MIKKDGLFIAKLLLKTKLEENKGCLDYCLTEVGGFVKKRSQKGYSRLRRSLTKRSPARFRPRVAGRLSNQAQRLLLQVLRALEKLEYK